MYSILSKFKLKEYNSSVKMVIEINISLLKFKSNALYYFIVKFNIFLSSLFQ